MDSPPESYRQLMKDVKRVQTYVQGRSWEELLAYLEAHYSDRDRVQTVIRELRGDEEFVLFNADGDDNEEQAVGESLSEKKEKICFIDLTEDDDECYSEIKSSKEPKPSTSAVIEELPYEKQFKLLMEMFPDGDPHFFADFAEGNYKNTELVNEIVNGWLQNKGYKKLEEIKQETLTEKIIKRNFAVDEILEMFPDPDAYFLNLDRIVNDKYKEHLFIYVMNNFPNLTQTSIAEVLVKNNYHLVPSVKSLQFLAANEPKRPKRRNEIAMPDSMDELFYKELAYLESKAKIQDHLKRKEKDRQKAIENARNTGTLMTCECCFNDELLLEDMLPCKKDHLFCKDCIRLQAEVNIGASKLQFPCLNGYCEEEFSLDVLQQCLRPNIFSIIFRKVQEEEILKAEIPDLESCPFCPFSAIMPNSDDKIFKCLNPECLKETCRLCKELSHVPLRCNEVEKKAEVGMRTYIENKMTDALLRTCPNCKRRFIKDYGCNKMTCTCGQMMCYVCKQPIKDYTHFEKIAAVNSDKCQLYSNDAAMHHNELKTSAETARKEYLQKHPELADIELKHDPLKQISVNKQFSHQLPITLEAFRIRHPMNPLEIRPTLPKTLTPNRKSVEYMERMCKVIEKNHQKAAQLDNYALIPNRPIMMRPLFGVLDPQIPQPPQRLRVPGYPEFNQPFSPSVPDFLFWKDHVTAQLHGNRDQPRAILRRSVAREDLMNNFPMAALPVVKDNNESKDKLARMAAITKIMRAEQKGNINITPTVPTHYDIPSIDRPTTASTITKPLDLTLRERYSCLSSLVPRSESFIRNRKLKHDRWDEVEAKKKKISSEYIKEDHTEVKEAIDKLSDFHAMFSDNIPQKRVHYWFDDDGGELLLPDNRSEPVRNVNLQDDFSLVSQAETLRTCFKLTDFYSNESESKPNLKIQEENKDGGRVKSDQIAATTSDSSSSRRKLENGRSRSLSDLVPCSSSAVTNAAQNDGLERSIGMSSLFKKKPVEITNNLIPKLSIPVFSGKLVGGKKQQSDHQKGLAVATDSESSCTESKSFLKQQEEMLEYWKKNRLTSNSLPLLPIVSPTLGDTSLSSEKYSSSADDDDV